MTRLSSMCSNILRPLRKMNSSVITVGFVSGSPETSAMVANTVMEDTSGPSTTLGIRKSPPPNQWIQDQLHQSELGVDDAEANLNAFVRTHDTAQVQGSATAAIQVSEDEKALITAQQTLAEKQEALASVQHGNIGATHEALDSRSIETDEEMISKLAVQMANMASYDPRRPMLQHQVDSLRAHIAGETAMIGRSLNRDVQIAAATVRQLQHSLDRDKALAQGSSIDDATLRQLTADLEAKRQLLVAFQTQAAQLRGAAEQTPTASVMFHALPPDRPAHQFGAISLIIGFVAGILGMSGLVVMRSQMQLKLFSTADITALTGLQVFGSLPRVRHADLLAPGRTASMVTETFRSIWIKLRDEKGPVVLVTSTEMGEGKTTVAETMARRFVGDGHRVLLIDGDMRHPRLGRLFNLQPAAVGRSTDPAKLVQQIDASGLYVLPSQATDNPVRLLSSAWFAEFIAACRANYDFVIIDSPPIMAFPDATLLAELATNIVYVVQSGIPTDRVFEGIRRFSDQARQKMFTFMSKVPLARLEATDYYRGYDKRRG